jgi:hypothetical protein
MASLAPAEKAPTGKPLKVGSPHEPAEREADRIADILTAPAEPALPVCAACAAGGAPCAACGEKRPAEGGMRRPLGKPLQAKLTIGQPNDVYEQEADRVAEQVMKMALPIPANVQRQPEDVQSAGIQSTSLAEMITPIVQRQREATNEEPLQEKCETCGEEEQVQRSADGSTVLAQPDLESRIKTSQGGGSPLPDEVRGFIEPRFGTDFSQVRVHTDGEAAQMNQELGAQAFTHRNHIYYGAGKAPAKDEFTGHELTHVVQQGAITKIQTHSKPQSEFSAVQVGVSLDKLQPWTKDTSNTKHAHLHVTGRSTLGSATIQEPVLQMMRFVGTTCLASVTILQELAMGDNTAAMRVVVRAINEAVIGSGTDVHIVCSGGGDQFDLIMTSEDAVLMRQQLNDRIQALASAAQTSSLDGGDPGRNAISQDALTEGFNREFYLILPALRQDNRRMSGGERNIRPNEFTSAEVHEMFSSATQQRKILEYCDTHMIPDRLFNGDDTGNANAQQRILMSAHILAHGTIQAGSFTQRLHARFCGHWVELVNNYAGVGTTGGRGIENEFDHEGNIVVGSGYLTGEYEGERTDVNESERGEGHPHRLFRRAPLPISDFDTIQAGDWLYVFVNTDTAGGDHSVIFSNWLSNDQESGGVHYRRAAVFSQTSVERGATRDEWLLGDQAGRVGGHPGHPVYPITRVVRHNPDDHPPGTVGELESADLGVRTTRSSRISRLNDQFIRRHTPRRQHIDRNALNHFLQESNNSLLDQLEGTGRAEPGQLMLWQATNQSTDLEVLVRLNERLNNLIRGATTLSSAEEAQAARVDPRREAALAEAEAERARLEDNLEQLDTDIQRLGAAREIDDEAAPLRAQRQVLYRERQRVMSRLSNARASRRTEVRAELIERRREIDAQRAELLVQIQEIETRRDAAIQAARSAEGTWRVGGRSAREHYNRLLARRESLERDIQALDEAGGFRMAHPGREFRSAETMGRLTGLLEHANPQPTWSNLLESLTAIAD